MKTNKDNHEINLNPKFIGIQDTFRSKSNSIKWKNQDVQNKKNKIFCLEILRSVIGKVALTVLIVVFLERTYKIINNFLRDPTSFETHYVPQYHANFPALTLCPMNGYKLEVLQVK